MFRNRNTEDNNFFHLTWDIIWFGIAWVTVTRFLSVYAIRVGASPLELGWITAGPPIGMMLGSFVAVWWRNRFPDSIKAVMIPTIGFRMSFLLLAITPLLPLAWRPLWLVLSVTLPAFPQGMSNIIFLTLLKETTPEYRLTALLGRRTLAVNLALGAGALSFGVWLEHMPFLFNYTMMFGVAFVLAMISAWHLKFLKPLDPESVKPVPQRQRVNVFDNPDFRRVLVVAFVGHVAFFSVFPVVPLRLMEELGAGEGYMALFSVMELTAGALVAVFLSRIVQRFGNRNMVAVAILCTSVAALVIALAPNPWIALLGAMLTGAGWSTAEIGTLGYFTQTVPTRNMAYFTRAYSQTVWVAIFIAPFLGTTLVQLGLNMPTVLMLGAGLRVAAGVYMLLTSAAARQPLAHAPAAGD